MRPGLPTGPDARLRVLLRPPGGLLRLRGAAPHTQPRAHRARAAPAAGAGLDAFVFVPSDLEQGKIVGSAVYGPTLVAVDGSYDEVNRLCSELSDKYPWAFVNINMRPYYAEGSKTLAYEVCEQLGWQAPDHCIVPLASGSLYTKIYKGLKEMAWLGLVEWRGTRMSGAQALGCSPIVEAWERQSFNIKTQEAVAPRLQPSLAIQPTITSFEEALSERTGALPAARK